MHCPSLRFARCASRLLAAAAICLLCLPSAAPAQGRVGFLAGIGVLRYSGDVGQLKNKIIVPAEVLNLYGRIGIAYRLTDHVETSLSFLHGTVEDADSLSDNNDQLVRNQSFKSPVDELSLQFDFSLFRLSRQRRVNPFVFAGAGAFRFNPKGYFNGTWYNLQPLGTEGQYIDETSYPDPYKRSAYSFIVGGGVSFQLAPLWRLRLEAGYHLTTTDYLDDVSIAYPDSAQLAATPNGPLAVQLSNRRLEQAYPKAGRSRGNADSKDSYIHIGITLIFNPEGRSDGYGNGGYSKRKSMRQLRKKQKCPAFGS